jgi:UDP-glucuronate 4-epimerase
MGEFVKVMQEVFGKKTYIINKELQQGEVLRTYADMTPMKEIYGFTPKTSIREGLQQFALWFNDYYGEK